MKIWDMIEFDLRSRGRVVLNLKQVTHFLSAKETTTVVFTGGTSVEVDLHIDDVIAQIDEHLKTQKKYYEGKE